MPSICIPPKNTSSNARSDWLSDCHEASGQNSTYKADKDSESVHENASSGATSATRDVDRNSGVHMNTEGCMHNGDAGRAQQAQARNAPSTGASTGMIKDYMQVAAQSRNAPNASTGIIRDASTGMIRDIAQVPSQPRHVPGIGIMKDISTVVIKDMVNSNAGRYTQGAHVVTNVSAAVSRIPHVSSLNSIVGSNNSKPRPTEFMVQKVRRAHSTDELVPGQDKCDLEYFVSRENNARRSGEYSREKEMGEFVRAGNMDRAAEVRIFSCICKMYVFFTHKHCMCCVCLLNRHCMARMC